MSNPQWDFGEPSSMRNDCVALALNENNPKIIKWKAVHCYSDIFSMCIKRNSAAIKSEICYTTIFK